MSNTLIMIPVFNGCEHIKRSLDSCLKQTLTSEVWVVDNQSTDSTQKIVNEYEDSFDNIKMVINENNLGRNGNLNRCIDLFMDSEYKYLKFLFSGDELPSDSINIVEIIFTNNDGLSIVNGLYIFNNGKSRKSSGKYFSSDCRVGIDVLVEQGVFPSASTGTLNSVTYSKQGIGDLRSNPLFLGIGMFHNDILLNNGDIYYTNNVLGIFNLESHSSFDKQFEYLYKYEYAFVKMFGLQSSKKYYSVQRYKSLEHKIAEQLVVDIIKIGKFKLLFSVIFKLVFQKFITAIEKLKKYK